VIWDAVGDVISAHGFLTILGWSYATAMLLGGTLVQSRDEFLRWGLTVGIYAVFLEIARRALLTSIGQEVTLRPLALAIIMTLIYGLGIGMGMILVRVTSARTRKQGE
jgi:hypothetical protein